MEKQASSAAAVDEQLFRAVKEGNLDEIQALIRGGANVHAVNPEDNYKPIHEAARFGHLHVVEWLLDERVNADTIDTHGYTPLHVASKHSQLEMVKFLVNRNADVHAKSRNFEKPIHLATRSGHIDVIEYFLNNGSHVDEPGYRNCTPLHIASLEGNLEVVKFLLGRHSNMYARTNSNERPIQIAVRCGHKYVVKVLLDNGTDEDSYTTLHFAISNGYLDVVQFLIDKGVSIDVPLSFSGANTLLHLVVEYGHSKIVQLLIDNGANVHAVTKQNGSKPIHSAVSCCRLEIFEILLSNGNSVEETDRWGRTPLHFAAEKSQLEVAQFLLDKGANVHARLFADPHQKAIHVAAERGHKSMVQFLLNNGNDVDELDEQCFTPLHHAIQRGCLDIIQFLVSKHADIHAKTIHGQKPVHQAAFYGHREIVEFFLNKGVNANDIDKDGQSPLHLASMQGHLEVVQLLIKYINNNADIDSTPSAQDGILAMKDALSRSTIDAQDKEGCTPLHLVFKSRKPMVEIVQCLLQAGARSDIKDNCHNTATCYFLEMLDYKAVDTKLFLVPEILERMNFFDIDSRKHSAAHFVIYCLDDRENAMLILQYQKDLNIKDDFGWTPLNLLTVPFAQSSVVLKKKEMIRFLINHGAYFKTFDCENIIGSPCLKKDLFTDVKLCTQSFVNKFNNKDLPKVCKRVSSEFPYMDKFKLDSAQVRQIELAVEEQIKVKGYCNVLRLMSNSQAMIYEKVRDYCGVPQCGICSSKYQ